MNQNSKKDVYDWRALAARAVARAGLEPVRSRFLGDDLYTSGGDVAPSVQVFVPNVTFTHVRPFAYFGVYIEDFEREWRDRLLSTSLPPNFSESQALCLHALNVASLRPAVWAPNLPSEQDIASAEDWLGRAVQYARDRLPNSVSSLVSAIKSNRIADHDVDAYLGHPVKVRGLVRWLHRVHDVDVSQHVLPLLNEQTDPYDVSVMLDPG